jgi:hypothetical protein
MVVLATERLILLSHYFQRSRSRSYLCIPGVIITDPVTNRGERGAFLEGSRHMHMVVMSYIFCDNELPH